MLIENNPIHKQQTISVEAYEDAYESIKEPESKLKVELTAEKVVFDEPKVENDDDEYVDDDFADRESDEEF